MHEELSLVATSKLALNQLEASGLLAGLKSEDALPALRKLIEVCQKGDVAEGDELIEWLEETWLRHRGILVFGLVTVEDVKAQMAENGFGELASVLCDEPLLQLVEERLGDVQRVAAAEVAQKAAQDLIDYLGLKWREAKDMSSSTTSGSVDAT